MRKIVISGEKANIYLGLSYGFLWAVRNSTLKRQRSFNPFSSLFSVSKVFLIYAFFEPSSYSYIAHKFV